MPSRQSADKLVLLPHRVQGFLLRWENREKRCKLGVPFVPSLPKKRLITDTSLLSWSTHQDEHVAKQTWTSQESWIYLKFLELQAVHKASKWFPPFIRILQVQVKSGNGVLHQKTKGSKIHPFLYRSGQSLDTSIQASVCNSSWTYWPRTKEKSGIPIWHPST